MSKVKIKIVLLGHVLHAINLNKISKWKSDLFEVIICQIKLEIDGNSDGNNWEYLDDKINHILPERSNEDVLLAITNVPLQQKYFIRSFQNNKVCLTYDTMANILNSENIPLENLLLRMLYFIGLTFKYCNGKIPMSGQYLDIIHHETKCCVFNMNGIKSDVIYSLNKPKLCKSCIDALSNNSTPKINRELLLKVQSELKNIKKSHYYQLFDFIKRNPIWSLVLSSILAVVLGIIGSTISTILWENVFK